MWNSFSKLGQIIKDYPLRTIFLGFVTIGPLAYLTSNARLNDNRIIQVQKDRAIFRISEQLNIEFPSIKNLKEVIINTPRMKFKSSWEVLETEQVANNKLKECEIKLFIDKFISALKIPHICQTNTTAYIWLFPCKGHYYKRLVKLLNDCNETPDLMKRILKKMNDGNSKYPNEVSIVYSIFRSSVVVLQQFYNIRTDTNFKQSLLRYSNTIILVEEEIKSYSELWEIAHKLESKELILDDFVLNEELVECFKQLKFLIETQNGTFEEGESKELRREYEEIEKLFESINISASRVPSSIANYDRKKEAMTNMFRDKLGFIKLFCGKGKEKCKESINDVQNQMIKEYEIDEMALNQTVATQKDVLNNLLKLLKLVYEYEYGKQTKSWFRR